MKIEHHLNKIERISKTLEKLNDHDDYETIIEDIMLLAAHYLNAAMHCFGTLKEDQDIKHNIIYGILLRENKLGDKSKELADLFLNIEELRPSHVYGKGKNGETAKSAKEAYIKIKEICTVIINERKL